MDFSAQYQYPGGQPYQSFISIPPLTPNHSHSTTSDDFNTASPPERYDDVNPEQFQTYDFTQAATFPHPSQPQNTHFSGPPTPPNPAHFTNSRHPHQPKSTSQMQHPPGLVDSAAAGGDVFDTQFEGLMDDANLFRGGSDEDESLRATASGNQRRKEQNRKSQQAFRQRKEKHLKDLEMKLASLEAAQQQTSVENESLKRSLQKVSTERDILKATSTVAMGHHSSQSPEPAMTGPMNYRPTDFYSNVLQNHDNKFPSHRITTSDDGQRLLAAGATWDFIINHELYRRGLVDVSNVSERLKTCARCDGQGPVFSEASIIHAIEESVASGSDDLL